VRRQFLQRLYMVSGYGQRPESIELLLHLHHPSPWHPQLQLAELMLDLDLPERCKAEVQRVATVLAGNECGLTDLRAGFSWIAAQPEFVRACDDLRLADPAHQDSRQGVPSAKGVHELPGVYAPWVPGCIDSVAVAVAGP
jgi:hypothetical protein